MDDIEIHSESGYGISVKQFEPESDFDTVVLIIPANGVKQSFYSGFANFLRKENKAVFTFDYGGIGDSKKADLQSFDTTVVQWGRYDLDAVISHIKSKYGDKKKVVVAHSIGGQILGLAPSSLHVDKIIFIGVQSGYWKFWEGFGRLKMLAVWYFLFPVFTKLYGYMPTSKVSAMQDLPKSAAMEWRKWCLSPNYLFDHVDGLQTYYDKITCPLISYSTAQDEFAPREAVDWFTEKYVNCERQRIHLKPEKIGVKHIGHFGFFKKANRDTLWAMLMKQINE
jgi:predicted alpha/beta hydrolase